MICSGIYQMKEKEKMTFVLLLTCSTSQTVLRQMLSVPTNHD